MTIRTKKNLKVAFTFMNFFTLHVQHERGKAIGVGVHIYKNVIESYFSDQLTFSNIRGRISCRIYGLALPLLSPEMLSSSTKSRIFCAPYSICLEASITISFIGTPWK